VQRASEPTTDNMSEKKKEALLVSLLLIKLGLDSGCVSASLGRKNLVLPPHQIVLYMCVCVCVCVHVYVCAKSLQYADGYNSVHLALLLYFAKHTHTARNMYPKDSIPKKKTRYTLTYNILLMPCIHTTPLPQILRPPIIMDESGNHIPHRTQRNPSSMTCQYTIIPTPNKQTPSTHDHTKSQSHDHTKSQSKFLNCTP